MLDDRAPHVPVTQTLSTTSDYSPTAYGHELTPSLQHPYELSVIHFIAGKIGDQRDQVTCLSSHPDV